MTGNREKLEEIMAQASPGPWVRWLGHADVYAGPVTENTPRGISAYSIHVCSCEGGEELELEEDEEEESPTRKDLFNAELIAKGITALPSLLDVLLASKEYLKVTHQMAEGAVEEQSVRDAELYLLRAIKEFECLRL